MSTLALDVPDELYQRYQRLRDASHGALDTILVTAIENALDQESTRRQQERDEVLERLRDAVGDRMSRSDPYEFLHALGIEPIPEEDLQTILATIPALDPPLSQTIIDEREDRV